MTDEPATQPWDVPTNELSQDDATPIVCALPTRRSRLGRELALAMGGLGLVVGGLVAYLAVVGRSASTAETNSVVAESWVGGGTGGADSETAAGVDTESGSDSSADGSELLSSNASDLNSTDSAEPDLNIRRGILGNGVAVITSLTRLGLSMADAHAIISALDGIFDFRKAKPGETFEVRLDPQTGKPIYFRYDASLVEVYEVERRGDSLVGRRKNIPTRKTLRRFGGTISSSLYRALDAQGAHPSLTAKMVEVLSNLVDFYKAQRPGDSFRLIAEEESLDGTSLGYGPVLALEYSGVKSGKKRFFRYESSGEVTYYDEKSISLPRSVLAIPVSYSRISSTFGMRFHPVLRRKKFHNGVDFAAAPGTSVWAAGDGTVRTAGNYGANGNLVVLDHGEGLSSCYAHLLRFGVGIKVGVKVRRKQVIGQVGNTGRSTGPHLHYGLKQGGRFMDPLKYKVRPGTPPPRRDEAAVAELTRKWNQLLDATPIRPPTEPLEAHSDDDDVMGDEDGGV